jgi:hypothetical protein
MIEERIGFAIPIQEFFDLIVGTRFVLTLLTLIFVFSKLLTFAPSAEAA